MVIIIGNVWRVRHGQRFETGSENLASVGNSSVFLPKTESSIQLCADINNHQSAYEHSPTSTVAVTTQPPQMQR